MAEFKGNLPLYMGLGILGSQRPTRYPQNFWTGIGPGLSQGMQMYAQMQGQARAAEMQKLKMDMYERQVAAQEAATKLKQQKAQRLQSRLDELRAQGKGDLADAMTLDMEKWQYEAMTGGGGGEGRLIQSGRQKVWGIPNPNSPTGWSAQDGSPLRVGGPMDAPRRPTGGGGQPKDPTINKSWAWNTLHKLQAQIDGGMPLTDAQQRKWQTANAILNKGRVYRDQETGEIQEVSGFDTSMFAGPGQTGQQTGMGSVEPLEDVAPGVGAPSGGRVRVLKEGGESAEEATAATFKRSLKSALTMFRESKKTGEPLSGVGGAVDRVAGVGGRLVGVPGSRDKGVRSKKLVKAFESMSFSIASLVYKQTGRALSDGDRLAVKSIVGNPESWLEDDRILEERLVDLVELAQEKGIDLGLEWMP